MKFIGGLLAIALIMPFSAAAEEKALDAQHQFLVSLVGTWSVKQSLWLGDAKVPKVDSGTADFAMVLKNRHLRQTLHIADGTAFEGLGYVGYDNGAGKFFNTWMDVNFPGLVVAYGGHDSKTNAYVFKGSMPPSTPGGDEVPVREVLTLVDKSHMRFEYYEARGGKEALTVRLEYTRAR